MSMFSVEDLNNTYLLTKRTFYTKLGTGYEFIYRINSIDKYGNISGHLEEKDTYDYFPINPARTPKPYRNLSLADIGSKIFFERHDTGESNYYRQFHSDVQKAIGSDNIIKNHIQSANFEKYEPGRAVSENYINDRIKEYNNVHLQQEQENTFRRENKNGTYFARIDVNTQLSLAGMKNSTNHYYLRLYISKNPTGITKKISMYEGTWQMYAGLTSENTYFDMHPNTHFMERGINYNISFLDSGSVVDWRAPITELYYKTDMKKLTFNYSKHFLEKVIHDKQYEHISKNLFVRDDIQYEHVALLKRRFEDNNIFNDLFTFEDQDIKFSNVDPFLLKMLRERRSHSELQDIILTIQGNQYDIIMAGLNENHIVQGCAGSGKTVILLHRLSYLLYNNNLTNDNIIILGPNDLFAQHISPLRSKLELTNVKCLTRDAYYRQLIQRHEKYTDYADYQDSSTLSCNYEIIHSYNFVEIFCNEYETIKNRIIRDTCNEFYHFAAGLYCKEDISTAILGRWRFETLNILKRISDEASLIERTAQSYYNETIEIAQFFSNAKAIISEALNRWRRNLEQSRFFNVNYSQKTIEVCRKFSTSLFYERLKEAISKLKKTLDGTNDPEGNYSKWVTDLRGNAKALSDVLNDTSFENSTHLRLIQKIFNTSFMKWYGSRSDNISNINATRTSPLSLFNRLGASRHSEKQANYETLAVCLSAFVKELSKEHYGVNISENASFNEIKNTDSFLYVCNAAEKLQEFTQWVAAMENAYAFLECTRIYERLVDGRYNVLQTRDFNDSIQWAQNIESISNILLKESPIQGLQDISEKSKHFQVIQKAHRSKCSGCNETLVKKIIAETGLSGEIIEKSSELQEYLEKETVVNICRLICGKTGVCSNGVPRLEIVHLLMVSLYYGSFKNKTERLFIDEGQEVSFLEYKVLKQAFDKIYFNIYGDVNQRTSINGISDWEKIKMLLEGNVWKLEENYRNTNQITEYCNSKLPIHKMKPIGYDGTEVKSTNIDQIPGLLSDIRKKPSSAIIAKNILRTNQVLGWDTSSFAIHCIDNGKTSLLEISEAKGLEFDSVLVIDTDMDENEKYIAYTRALNELYILNCK